MNSKLSAVILAVFLLMLPLFHLFPSILDASLEETIVEKGETTPPMSSGTRSGGVTFTNVTDDVGLSGVRGDSFAWGDYNNDGYQDLLVKGSRLFKNNGPPNWSFTEVTEEVGLEGSGYAVWGDYNNDGYLDFYAVGHPYEFWDTLWMNLGPPDYNFVNVTESAGNLDDGMPGLAAGWADYDRDGFLDLYIVNWRDDENIKYPDVLWHNNGDGTFTDVTVEAGVWEGDEPYAGMGVNWGDYNNDGWPDIYVSNYLVTPNYLYENNGDGTFTDVAHDKNAAGLAPAGGYYGHTAGSSWADYDHDGDLDMWVSNLAHTTDPRGFYTDYSQMLRNDGPSADYSFTDVRDETGIDKKPYMSEDELHFGIAWGDYDNDGDYDMFIPQIKSYVDYAYSYFFENNGDGTFTDVSDEVGVRVWDSDGACWADYNNDGFIDLITEGKYPYENGKYEIRLFRNNGGSNKWLEVELEASGSNRAAIGARVEVSYNGITQMKEVEGGTAGHSYQHSLVQHFGFGDHYGKVDVEVWWPSGEVTQLSGVELDRKIIVRDHDCDITIFEVSFSNSEPGEGEIVTIGATIQNAGRLSIESATIKFFEGDITTNPIGMEIVNDIDPGKEKNLQIQWDTTDKVGEHTITVLIENVNPPEDYTEDNLVSRNIVVKKYVPDLTISKISLSNPEPEEGESITITATIQNIGELEANYARIKFFDGDINTILIGIDDVHTIGPGSYKNANVVWDTTGKEGIHEISVLIEDVEPDEENVQNNVDSMEIEVKEPGQEPEQPPPENHPPVIVEFTAEPPTIPVRGSCTLTVLAEDVDGDSLTYTYDAPDGTIQGYGSIVFWNAPENEGAYEISVTVRDTSGAEDIESVHVEVKANVPPQIKSVNAFPESVRNNGVDTVLFEAKVKDENGLEDIEEVKIDLTEIGGSSDQRMADDGSEGDLLAGDGVYSFETVIPEGVTSGEKTFRITVKDKSGEKCSENLTMQVLPSDKEDGEGVSLFIPMILFIILAIIGGAIVFVFTGKSGKAEYP